MTVKAVWNIADIFNALMAFPNLIALLALNGVIPSKRQEISMQNITDLIRKRIEPNYL